MQKAVTLGLLLTAPLMTKPLDFIFNQVRLLRVRFIEAFLHSVMFCAAQSCWSLIATTRIFGAEPHHNSFVLSICRNFLLRFFVCSLVSASAAFHFTYPALQSCDYLLRLVAKYSLYAE
ncbi:MAG: hypothetical protein Q4P24_04910 [Rhodobacterales bacterium]|nr:hypothetical protein [Rhodobacterales bacterium]